MPLGAAAYLALRRVRPQLLAFFSAVAIGTVLSATVEMLQLFTPHRHCSTVDLASNILGTTLGLLAGYAFQQIADIPSASPGFRLRDRRAIALLYCWIFFLVFPLYPDSWLASWRAKLSVFFVLSASSPAQILVSVAECFAVGRLLVAAGAKAPVRWLLLLLLLLPIQFGIVTHSPKAVEFAGAALGVLVFYLAGKGPVADGAAGIGLLAALTLRGLSPFHFADPGQAFLWIPFGGFLGSEWQGSVSMLLGKSFRYGASIWLMGRAGTGNVRAVAIVAAVLAGIEVLQIWIPGHVAETTDPLLAVLLYLGLRALERTAPAAV
jgi:hypothetical protein